MAVSWQKGGWRYPVMTWISAGELKISPLNKNVYIFIFHSH
jgi:hypothetical protein